MLSNRRFRRPRIVVRAVRKLRAGAAAMGVGRGRGRHLRAVPPLAQDEVHLAHAQPAAPPPSDPKSKRSRNAFIMVLLVGLSLAVWWGAHEVQTSAMQAQYFSGMVGKLSYRVEPGPSSAIRYPKDSPYDERLGYANMPDYLGKLKTRDYTVSAQSRFSPKLMELTDMGVFATYREKTKTGLQIYDCRAQQLFTASYPERVYGKFEQTPMALVNSLLFIEN